MFKNLNAQALGITGRQSELIELALTYRFRGIDLAMDTVVKRVRSRGIDTARRFLESAELRVGTFEIPIDWRGDETSYRSGLVELKEIAEIAQQLSATVCIASVDADCDGQTYQENFEKHRSRLSEVSEVLSSAGVRLALTFQAAADARKEDATPFIHRAEALLTLLRTISSPQVGLAFDSWQWHVGGGGMDQLRELPIDQLFSVRLADVPSDAELSKIPSTERRLPSDDGLIDFASLVRYLAEASYDGPVTLYPHASAFSGMTREAIVKRATATLNALWTAAGIQADGTLQPMPAPAAKEPDSKTAVVPEPAADDAVAETATAEAE